MHVHTAATATVEDVGREGPPTAVDPPPPTGSLPTRRAVLGVLASVGATAGALHLSGRLVDAALGGPSAVDPATALQVHVTALTATADEAAPAAAHGGHGSSGPAAVAAAAVQQAPEDQVFSQLVTVALVVRNTTGTDLLFSPGQVRLRLPDGTGVMPVAAERPPGAVAGGTSTSTWVRFLAPPSDGARSVDYLPAGAVEPRRLPVIALPAHGHEGAR